LLKTSIRRALGRINRWLAEPPSSSGPNDDWASSYTLNPICVEIMNHPACRHSYAWGVMQGVNLGRALKIERVSAIEFGVAGGTGLVALEAIAEKAEAIFDVKVDVFGFDTGVGLPKPEDWRDMPNLWSAGSFPMDVEKLKSRLSRAQLILGAVSETVPRFTQSHPAPVSFISFDLDLYSSTKAAFSLFDAHQRILLPRVHCYFDDILGYTFGDHVGERLAIEEFNSSHALRKISPIHGLRYYAPEQYANRMWEKNYMAHIFDHELYGRYDGLINPSNEGERCGLA
jgi:hypothetical protein